MVPAGRPGERDMLTWRTDGLAGKYGTIPCTSAPRVRVGHAPVVLLDAHAHVAELRVGDPRAQPGAAGARMPLLPVLRALDTIEDDMTLDIKVKEPLLRGFHEKMEIDGWTFHDNGPDEKDRHLLVSFADVIVELKKIKPAYYAIIRDVHRQDGQRHGRLCRQRRAQPQRRRHGERLRALLPLRGRLVGEGLTRLFVESELANRAWAGAWS